MAVFQHTFGEPVAEIWLSLLFQNKHCRQDITIKNITTSQQAEITLQVITVKKCM